MSAPFLYPVVDQFFKKQSYSVLRTRKLSHYNEKARTMIFKRLFGNKRNSVYRPAPDESGFFDMIEALSDGVVVVDPLRACFVRANAVMRDMLGYDSSEIENLRICDVDPGNEKSGVVAVFTNEMKPQGFLSENIQLKRKNGTFFSAEVHISSIHLGGVDYIFGAFFDMTESKRFVDEKYQAFYDNSPLAYQSLDDEGCFLDINPAWLHLLGYERDEVIGKWFGDFLHPDWIPKFEDGFKNFKANGTVCDVEFKMRRKDGAFVDIELNGCIGYLPDGGFRQTYCVFQDVTKRKQAEQKLVISEATYRDLMRHLSCGVVVASSSTSSLMANPAACRLLGFPEDQVRGMTAIDPQWHFLREDHSQMPVEEYPIQRVLSSGQAVSNLVVGIVQPLSGDLVWVLVDGFVAEDLSGESEQVIISFTNITERKHMEEQLMDDQRRMEGILEGTSVGTWEWNVQTGDLILNERWAEMIGYTLAELAPVSIKTWERLSHPEDLSEIHELLKKHFEGELDSYEYELRMRHQDGSWVWIHDRGKVVSWTLDHKPLMMMGTHQDVTEAHMLQERLRQTEKMDAIGQLAGGVAHDFNNQLTGVLGYADLLESELSDPRLKEYARNIINASERAAELTSQLLAFGRKGKNLDVSVSLHKVIGEVVAMLERSIDKRITVLQDLAASRSVVRGDPTQIYNALLNLGINARDAMPEGGDLTYATDEVSLNDEFIQQHQCDIEVGRYLCISVSDTGVGMSDEVRRKIFEPFFTTKPEGKGTGLGLSSVYGTVKNHNGAIHVCSEPGAGTVFRIYFPVCEEEGEDAGGSTVPVHQGTGRILLVDDEAILRTVGSAMLTSLGYQVKTCVDGQAAVEYYQDHWQQTDLVLLDMMMPRMDGAQTFNLMREINPKICAVLSSGYSIDGKAQSIMDKGVVAFIDKPFSRSELADAVEAALGRVL